MNRDDDKFFKKIENKNNLLNEICLKCKTYSPIYVVEWGHLKQTQSDYKGTGYITPCKYEDNCNRILVVKRLYK